MMGRVLYSLLVGVLVVPVLAEEKELSTDLESHKPLAGRIRVATSVTLYEGTPRVTKKSKSNPKAKVITIQGHPFYEEKLQLEEKDAKRLKELFVDVNNFAMWRGAKKCGGFHPDYAIEWSDGKNTVLFQLCLGCQEIKGYSENASLYADVKSKAFNEMKTLLAKYRKNRPAEKKGRP